MEMRQHHGMYVDGRVVDAHSNSRANVYNPATGRVIASVPSAGESDVDDAVAAARTAFEGPWRHVSPSDRGGMLRRLAAALEARADEFSLVQTMDTGKTIRESEEDVRAAVALLEYYAGAADKHFADTMPSSADEFIYTLREPGGVCGLIVPSNYPLVICVEKLAPALVAGCTVVVKSPSDAPITPLMLCAMSEDAGIPPGVVNIVTGPGRVVGSRIVSHPDVDRISFTGRSATGREVMRDASETLKPLTLELGGKSPTLVFADADLNAAVEAGVYMIYANAGQICDARSRILVHDTLHDEFVERFVEATNRLSVGDPLDRSNHVGAITTRRSLERIERYIATGQREGARLVVGGHRLEIEDGFFHELTAFAGVENSMAIAQDEIFGPVASIGSFSHYEEAIDYCNQSKYSLGATVWTEDLSTAHAAIRNIDAGTVWVNSSNWDSILAPFGGRKLSGYGLVLGMQGLDGFVNSKTVGISFERSDGGFALADHSPRDVASLDGRQPPSPS